MAAHAVHVEDVIMVKARRQVPRTMFLSSIDQRFGAYQRNFFVFHSDTPMEGVVSRIREAMEELLLPYDFFSGRLQMNTQSNKFEIRCSNAGAALAVARVDMSVEDASDASVDTQPFLYFPTDAKRTEDLPLLTVQLTGFRCGKGFALGVLCHHSITDANSGINFLHNFSSVARGDGVAAPPSSDRAVFKARDPPRPSFPHDEFVPHANLNTSRYSLSLDTAIGFLHQPEKKKTPPPVHKRRKVFHFSFQSMTALKSRSLQEHDVEASTTSPLRECTSFEALAALVWRAYSIITSDKSPEETLRLRFVLDVRNKLTPPLGSNFCGNAIYWAHAEVKLRDMIEKPLSHVIRQIQNARKSITDEYLRSGWDFLELHPDHWYGKNCDMAINAWPRSMLSAKEFDFGWGKPRRVEFPFDPETSTVMFVPVERGVDVSLLLEPHQTAPFESLIGL